MDRTMIFYRWKNAKCIVTGKDHIETKKPCQDRVASHSKNGIHAIALADGAGSRAASEYGAEIITNSVVKYLVEHFEDLIISTENEDTGNAFTSYYTMRERLIVYLNEELNKFIMTQNKFTYRDLASTLLFTVFDENHYLIGHLGDGLIASYEHRLDEKYTKVISVPENGAESHITYFFTEPDVSKHFRLYRGTMRNKLGFILMSDGPEEVLFDPTVGLSPNVEPLFKNFHLKSGSSYSFQLEELLEKRIANYSYDDLSLNLIYLDEWLYNNEDIQEDFVDDIRSLEQVKNYSKNAYMLDASIEYRKQQFSGFKGMMEFIRSRI